MPQRPLSAAQRDGVAAMLANGASLSAIAASPIGVSMTSVKRIKRSLWAGRDVHRMRPRGRSISRLGDDFEARVQLLVDENPKTSAGQIRQKLQAEG